MRAVLCYKYGPPDVLEIKEVEKPTPNDNEVLIRVCATTVNRTDCGILRASPFIVRLFTGLLRPRIALHGCEFAGQIEAVGKDVSLFKIGSRVFGFSDTSMGAHAEYMTIPENAAIAMIPEGINYEQAAASTEGAHYAYNLIKNVKLQRGQKVLVNGSTGAIGSAAVQMLKHFGAQVTAVCNTKNIDLVRSLGADRVIDYTKEDFTKEDTKYSYIFDTYGKASFIKCRRLLNPGGLFVTCDLGYKNQNIVFMLLNPFIGSKKVILPLPKDQRGDVLFIKKLMESGEFKAVIDRTYPLENIVDAYKYVETGQKTGNVVIAVGGKI